MKGRGTVITAAVILVATATAAVYALRRDRPDGDATTDRDSVVMLGDSITEEGRWTELFPTVPLPRGHAPDAVRATNEAVTALAAERGLPVLDLHRAFDDGAGGLRPSETRDGIHLSPAGSARWAALLEPWIGAPD